ncbi:MAG: six-hairpin glycosidase [Bacteroidetes bacterium HGW-Bacteroidetes-17]|jgi:hypothetical protein|nr:MAG: six-hairpin glycosidase [Bacteroidetes bacterium HGW-Bacteroidetes-17]
MKNSIFVLLTLLILSACSSFNKANKDYPVQPVSFTDVKLTDHFWLPRIETNRKVTIPYDFQKCEETDRINNFAVAGRIKEGSFKGIRYNDSDVYKVMEAAAYSLSTYPDPVLEKYMDSVIALVAAAQEEDGYLYTARTINPDTLISNAGESRWSMLKQSHELYNIGHMYEAAVAYYEATGKRTFLDVALKSADLVCSVFGPAKNQLHDVPGHQEIEIGLVKLYRTTGDEKYLKMAKYFLDQRGDTITRTPYTYDYGGSSPIYTQDHQPVTRQCEAVGHAVRAAYMYTGMADIAALTGDTDYLKAIDTLWDNVVYRKTYITGGIGAMHDGEAFGPDYYLPNLTAYNETCAAIANMLWNQRMFLLSGESKYIDVLERTLYNGFLSGVSFQGDKFFYPNPLESDGSHERAPWFDCSCCPTNVARFLPSLPAYIYAHQGKKLFVNLFIGNTAEIEIQDVKIKIEQKTDYPWDGKVDLTINPESPSKFIVALRLPLWARNQPMPGDLYSFREKTVEEIKILVNGEPYQFSIESGYALIDKDWKTGDHIRLNIPMPVQKILANEKVAEDKEKMAFSRGPIVYCAEGIDNGERARNLMIDPDLKFTSVHQTELLNGITTLESKAYQVSFDKNREFKKTEQNLMLIPYYAWAHRGNGEMAVWLPFTESASNPTLPPTKASDSHVTASYIYDQLSAVNDQINPKNSNDQEIPRLTFWSHKGTHEWVQYDFKNETVVSFIHIYWFDDGPSGGCRIPESWKAFYLEDNQWVEVKKNGAYPAVKDALNSIEIFPIKTKALRLEVQLQNNFSGGILEWKIE